MIRDSVFIPATASMAVIPAAFLFTACNSGKPAAGYAPVQAKTLRFRALPFQVLPAAGVALPVIWLVPLFPGAGRAQHREERPA